MRNGNEGGVKKRARVHRPLRAFATFDDRARASGSSARFYNEFCRPYRIVRVFGVILFLLALSRVLQIIRLPRNDFSRCSWKRNRAKRWGGGGGGGGGIEEWEILVWNSGEMERFLLPLSQTRRLKYASCVFERGEPLSLLLLLHLRNTLTMGNDVYARDGWLAKRESALSSTTFRGLSKPKLCLERETSKELKANEFSWERLDQNVSPLYRCQSPKTILRSHCRLVIVENIRAIGSKFWSIIYQVLFSCIKFTRRGFVVVARDWVTRDSRERVRTDTIFDSTTRTTLIALRGRINEHL